MKRTRSTIAAALIALLIASACQVAWPAERASAANTSYYVDSANGNDGNSGTSPEAPWRTIGKVNAKTNYQPGDRILFKAGGTWTGSIKIKNSGEAGNPIIVGKYGEGPKPIVNANAAYAAIDIENVSYITLQDLELTNYNAADPDDYLTGYYRRNGIWIKAFHQGPMNGITIRDMDIHDVTGMSVSGETTVTTTDGKDKNVNKNANAGILINAWEWETWQPKSQYIDLTIENNYIHDLSTIGISIDGHANDKNYFHKHVVVRGNTVINNGADAIIVGVSENPLVEYNVSLDAGAYGHGYQWIGGMWAWRTNGATFQYNEVGRVHSEGIKSEADSAAFDTDIATMGNHIFQYNYSHDNEGGFIMDMGRLQNGINIVRYNISENDKRNGWSGNTMNISGDEGLYYNNVFYNDLGIGFQIRNNPKATFMNNIFYVTDESGVTYPSGPKFYYNAFYGQQAPIQGLNNVVGDPQFVNPGQGGDGAATVEGYKLQPTSPLIGAGKAVAGHPDQDYWHNALYTGTPDIGAFEDPTSSIGDTVAPNPPTEVAVSEITDSQATLSWHAEENGVPLDAEVYDADTDQLIATVIVDNEQVVTGLQPNTNYSFYIKAIDRSGNASAPSAIIQAKTLTSVTVDNADAVVSGGWTAATGGQSFQDDYLKIPAGTGANTITWTPDLPVSGYYSVYYYLPNGSAARAGNAQYTVNGAAGSKTYSVDQRKPGGQWILLGMHRFDSGTAGSVQLSDDASGEVAADAVKFLYHDAFGPENVDAVALLADRTQLRLGETSGVAVIGIDEQGNELDLTADGAALQYVSDNPAVASIENGVITGVASGTTEVYARYDNDGTILTSNKAEIRVGTGYDVEAPLFTDANGVALSAVMPGVVQTAVTVYNSTELHSRVTMIVALYGDYGYVAMSSQEAVVGKFDHKTLQAAIQVPGDLAGAYLKVYVWDSTTFMRPLAEPMTFH